MTSFLSILTKLQDEPSVGITFLDNGHADFLSYPELLAQLPYTAGKLQRKSVNPEQYIVFQVTENRALIEMFWACAWLGAIPVIVPPALSASDEDRVHKVLEMLPSALTLVDDRTRPHVAADKVLLVNDVLNADADPIKTAFPANGNPIRLVQMSSGSTGYPKGIIVDEETLMSAMAATTPRHPQRFDNSMLTWLPLTHNLSLLGFHIYAAFRGFPQVLMPISDFVVNPLNWLAAITKYRPTVTACPNFGFVHALKYLQTRGIPEGVTYDLSSVQKLISASEPIDVKTAKVFSDKMAEFGLRENAVVAAYGMSEACLQITTTGIYEPLQTVHLERAEIKIGAHYKDIACVNGAEFVSVGKTVPGMEVSLRDDDGKVLEEDTLGEVFIRGTSLTHDSITHLGRVEHNLSKDGFLATGDIGIIHDDNLYIVARKKDIIFVNGKNYYSPDLEALLVAELGQDSVVLGRTSPATGEEEVVVFIPEDQQSIKDSAIITVLTIQAGVPVNQIVRISAIPRASNGKKMRRELESLL